MNDLKQKLRTVTEEDKKNLPKVSYSKLDLFSQCRRRYKLKYKDKMHTEAKNISLDIGSILHKGLELKGNYILKNEVIDFDQIKDVINKGSFEETEKDKENLIGIEQIQKDYFDEWPHYIDKMKLFFNEVLPTRINDNDWKVIGCEVPFEFVYDNKCIIHGFIDRVDHKFVNDTEFLRITDYKTSKKVFDQNKIKTPLQMVIYDLASLFIYGIIPTNHEYDFILLNEKQTTETGVCTKGYLKRGLKKIDSLLDWAKETEENNEYAPCPTPLCYWCPYAPKSYTPFADEKYGNNCIYHSLWTPDNKVFQVNKPYIPGEPEKQQRKLVF